MSSTTEDRWLSVDEIAAYLGIKRDTVYKWIDRKSMPAHKVGSLWKFKKEESSAPSEHWRPPSQHVALVSNCIYSPLIAQWLSQSLSHEHA